MQQLYVLNQETLSFLGEESESFRSSNKLVKLIKQSMEKFGLPDGALQNIPTTDRLAVGVMLKMDKFVDV